LSDCRLYLISPPKLSAANFLGPLQEALAEGISTGHPTMPEFRLEPDQVNDVISYLKSLE